MATNSPPVNWKLWHPANGVQFLVTGRKPLYPELDMSRFLHSTISNPIPGDGSFSTTSEGRKEVDEPHKQASPGGLKASLAVNAKIAQENTEQPKPNSDVIEKQDSEDEELPGDPPFTTLDYKVPEDAFRAARLATPGTPESFWSYTLYRGPGEDSADDAKVKVHYCRSKHTTERVCQYFLKEKVIGFDLEWVAEATSAQGPRRNVCLAQIASESRIALFHLSLFPKNDELVAPSFKRIMEDPNITKTGVWIKGDCTRLRKFLKIDSRGIFELSHLFKLVKHSRSGDYGMINKRLVSLAQQVEECLHLPMFKGQDVRSSDWSQPLRMDQIIYSASDAYAAVQLFALLEQQRKDLDPTPPRPYHAELGLPIRLADGVTLSEVEETAEEPEIKGEDKVPTTLSQDFISSATEDIKIEPETDTAEMIAETPKPRKRSTKTSLKLRDERIQAAEVWLLQYRTANPKMRAAPAALRSYYIWNSNEDLDPVAIAKLLRDPPLQTNTVVSYILEAIKLEKLPFQKTRLRTEVLDLLPEQVLEMRYRGLVKLCTN